MQYKLVIPEGGLTKEELRIIGDNINLWWILENVGKILHKHEAVNAIWQLPRLLVRVKAKTHKEIIKEYFNNDRVLGHDYNELITACREEDFLKLMQLAVENEKLKD